MVASKPDSVTIGPHDFQIIWSGTEMTRHARNSGEDRMGQTEIPLQLITIGDDRPRSGMQETLLHEILHAVIWEACITVPENPEETAENREEKLVGQLSGVLLDCLQRNPLVVNWLSEVE